MYVCVCSPLRQAVMNKITVEEDELLPLWTHQADTGMHHCLKDGCISAPLPVNTVFYSWQWESTLKVRIRLNMLWSIKSVCMNLLCGWNWDLLFFFPKQATALEIDAVHCSEKQLWCFKMNPKNNILCDVLLCEETIQDLLTDLIKFKIIATFKNALMSKNS